MAGRLPLFTENFLHARWEDEFRRFQGSAEAAALHQRIEHWAARQVNREKQAASTFIDVFFRDIWGYAGSGQSAPGAGYTLHPEFPIAGAGQTGGTGSADLALGWFGRSGAPSIPQAICEFKDIRADLDAPQRRKGNDRSPVQQCADYLREAQRGMFGNEVIRPTWAIVTDMNEFRLYWRDRMPSQVQRFFIAHPSAPDRPVALSDDTPQAAFQRFVFARLFHRDQLLATAGRPPLERLLQEQGIHERALENDFYAEYQAYREQVFHTLVAANPGFRRTRSKLVRLTQRLLDRCIFILFCEDMGSALRFPQNLLRDLLVDHSTDRHYDPEDTSIWHTLKRLFRAVRDGSSFGDIRLNRFNGGLFAEDPELDALAIPNRLFCAKNQGARPEDWTSDPKTLLYFSAGYNFGIRGAAAKSIGLYTLGRIFEQSITDLEFMEARADDRPSLTELSKRKRDGVYYTPEWVTDFIVRHTVGRKLAELRLRCGLTGDPGFGDAEIEHYRKAIARSARQTNPSLPAAVAPVRAYLARLDGFEQALAGLKIVDPACGSGAFLIQAMDELVAARRWITDERERVTGTPGLLDQDTLVKDVLRQNIYGVDINPESVEITRLALWLHTALPDKPLSSLDHTIRCGNSLVGPDFYGGERTAYCAEERERINAFDWAATFPEVFTRPDPGFDCVVGNPPYVKLQNFRRVLEPVTEYLLEANGADDRPVYRSTRTGNFDLYLPFVERGVDLLNAGGVMGYIAPSVWLLNEYGAGLRALVHEQRSLERWVDFGDYQVFAEAINYTSLQFYRRHASGVACVFAPDGVLGQVDWSSPDTTVPYAELPADDTWVLAPDTERHLLARLRATCRTLEQSSTGIIVGIQTSADHVFHLKRVAAGRYISFAESKQGHEVELEDGLLRCLVSGEQAKRYRRPTSATYLLFPYDDTGARARLLSVRELRKYPKAWAYLRTHEKLLRSRERSAFDDDEWYRFGRSQNIDKQKFRKLLVARLTVDLAVACDPTGAVALDNVDVNGILTLDDESLWFLLGVLNGPVANFEWKRRSKPFQHGFRSANKQFIAPLSIPAAVPPVRATIADRARKLQELHTGLRETVEKFRRRLGDCIPAPRDPSFLWEDIGTIETWKQSNPKSLRGRELTAWSKSEVKRRLDVHLEALQSQLRPGARLTAALDDGAVALFIDGASAIRAYVEEHEEPLLLAQWEEAARSINVAAGTSAKRLVDSLLDLRVSERPTLRKQIVELHASLALQRAQIAALEAEMNDHLAALYGLTAEERELIAADRR